MRKILIASDLSNRSARALKRAARLARASGAALTVLHVVDDELPPSIAEHQEEEARAALCARLGDLGADAEVLIAFGAPAVEILQAADRIDADLVVLGAHRPAFFADLILGANIARIARYATRPLLLVNSDADADYASVVVGVDFSAHARRALETAAALAPGARISALHTFHISFKEYQTRGRDGEIAEKLARPIVESATREMQAFLEGAAIDRARVTTEIVEDGPAVGLRSEVARRKADLVALGAHGRSGLARAFLGSIAEEMLMDPPCDVLVVRNGVRE